MINHFARKNIYSIIELRSQVPVIFKPSILFNYAKYFPRYNPTSAAFFYILLLNFLA